MNNSSVINESRNDYNSFINLGENTAYILNNFLEDIYKINYVSTFVLFWIGISGNLMTLCIFFRKKFRSTSIGIYLSALSAINCYSLILLLFSGFGKFSFNITGTYFFCKIYTFSIYWVRQSCSWLIVLACLDRLLAFLAINRLEFLKKLKAQLILILTLIIILMLFNFPSFFYTNFIFDGYEFDCDTDLEYSFILDWLNLILYIVLPCTIMIICIIGILVAFFIARKTVISEGLGRVYITRSTVSTETPVSNGSKYEFIFATISLSLFFLVFNIPMFAFLIYCQNVVPKMLTSEETYKMRYWYIIFRMLIYIHTSLPFFIYFTFNTLFRHEFFKFIKECTNLCYEWFMRKCIEKKVQNDIESTATCTINGISNFVDNSNDIQDQNDSYVA